MVIIRMNTEKKRSGGKNSEYLLPFFCSCFLVAFIGSLFISYLVYACAIVCLCAVIFMRTPDVFSFLLFSFSYAPFMVTELGTTSLFTYVELVSVIIFITRLKKIRSYYIILITLIILSAMTPYTDFKAIIKLLIIILLVYIYTYSYNKEYGKNNILYFIMGMLSSSFLGLFKENIPRLLTLYNRINYERIGEDYSLRYSGIFEDPNYFAVPLLLSISLCLYIIFFKKGNKVIASTIFALFSIAGFMTLSKSFYLAYAGVIILFVLFSSVKLYKRILISVIVTAFALVIISDYGLGDKLLARFTTIGGLTTGRTDIWVMYLNYLDKTPLVMLFGKGIDAPYYNGRAIHNIYIEMIYELGIPGTILFLTSIIVPLTTRRNRDEKKKLLNYVGLLIVALLYFFLDGLTAYEMPFLLIISYIILNLNMNNNRQSNIITMPNQ